MDVSYRGMALAWSILGILALSTGAITLFLNCFARVRSKHPIKYPFSLLYFHCTFAFAILHELLTYFHYDTRTI